MVASAVRSAARFPISAFSAALIFRHAPLTFALADSDFALFAAEIADLSMLSVF